MGNGSGNNVGGVMDEGNRMVSEKVLIDFIKYCFEHPDYRFWQAVRAWAGKDITVGGEDPFYWGRKLN